MVQHPTILELLMAIPGVAKLSGALKAVEEAAEFAKAARDLGILEGALGAERAAERAAEFSNAARGSIYKHKAAQATWNAEVAASDVHYHVEQHAKGSPPNNPQPLEGEFNIHNDATAVKAPYISNEGIKIVEDAEPKATNQAEFGEAIESTWSENDKASQANCKRTPGLKFLKIWGKPQYKVFDDVPTLQSLVANIREYGQVGKGDGLFYNSLDGQSGVKLSTEHYKTYIQKTTGRQGFGIVRITDKKWSRLK